MSTAKQLIVGNLNDSAAQLTRTVTAMPADKQVWKPLDTGRSVVTQVAEVAGFNNFVATTLATGTPPEFDLEKYQAFLAQHDTIEKALDALKTNTAKVVSSVEALPDDKLDAEVTLKMGENGFVRTLAQMALMAAGHMSYHAGQVNYIQTLYGDNVNH